MRASFLFAGLAGAAFVGTQAQTNDKVPITTASAEARELYLKGRDLAEKLRATDARRFYEQAVQKDKMFAQIHLPRRTSDGPTESRTPVTRSDRGSAMARWFGH